jgi:hypothetical protein
LFILPISPISFSGNGGVKFRKSLKKFQKRLIQWLAVARLRSLPAEILFLRPLCQNAGVLGTSATLPKINQTGERIFWVRCLEDSSGDKDNGSMKPCHTRVDKSTRLLCAFAKSASGSPSIGQRVCQSKYR